MKLEKHWEASIVNYELTGQTAPLTVTFSYEPEPLYHELKLGRVSITIPFQSAFRKIEKRRAKKQKYNYRKVWL